MDAINLGLGTPDDPFNFEKERLEIVARIEAAKRSGAVPAHLRTTERTTTTKAGRILGPEELHEVAEYDEYVQKLYETCEWKHATQLLRDRLARLPPRFDTYKLLINSEANIGALDAVARHAKEAYEWDPLFGEAYVMMATLDCMAMQPERSEAWLALVELIPGHEAECGSQIAATKLKIAELVESIDKVLAKITHLLCLSDFWVRLSKNLEYYRTFESDESRALISEIQQDPSSLRRHLCNDKIQWLVSMLSWTSAPLTYSPPTDEQLATRHWRKMNGAKTSTLMALPIELVLNILDFVDPPALGRLPQVSTFWQDLLTNDHRVWKRIYLNMWDPPIIYHVPDWLWMHAFRQRLGLCTTVARVWNRRNGDYSPSNPHYELNVRQLLSKFSFISPSFSDSISLIPDFVYGNVNHNIFSITKFRFEDSETSEAWPALPEPPSTAPEVENPNAGYLTHYFSHAILHAKQKPDNYIDPMRRTVKKAIPVLSRDMTQSLHDSNIINVLYYVLSKSDYADESQQAAKALSALAFHDRKIAHHLINIGAIELFSHFAVGDQYGEASDLVATLLIHKHGMSLEASESLHSACKIFPRLWAMNVLQDIKDSQRWLAGLSGVWRGRYFIGQPGYDTPFVEHFLYLHFHADMNYGHFVPQKDLDAAIADFKANVAIKPEYRFNSAGWIPDGSSTGRTREAVGDGEEDQVQEEDLFPEDDEGVQEGEARITGSGIDDFGPYRVYGRLNVVYRSVFLAKRYEFEPAPTKVVYMGGDLGIWGMGGTIKTAWPLNGCWKWWKDGHDYTLDQLHEMRQDAELAMQHSVQAFKNRDKLRMRLRTSLTQRLFPNAPAGALVGDEGVNVPHQPPPGLVQQQQQQGQQQQAAGNLRRGLRWSEVDFPLVNAMLDPIPPPQGPDLSNFYDTQASRGEYHGWIPEPLRAQAQSDPDTLVWFSSDSDYGRPLPAIHSMEDESARIEALLTKPVARSQIYAQPTPSVAGHADILQRLITYSNTLFHLEHVTESIHMLPQYLQDIEGLELPLRLASTPPIRRFQGESEASYVLRRRIFDRTSILAMHARNMLIAMHKDQAKIDGVYLLRRDIPFHDPRKMAIAHRWIDDWLRLPARMYIHDQDELHQCLAQALLSAQPDTSWHFRMCHDKETEAELVMRHDSNPTPTGKPRHGGPVLDDDDDEEEEELIQEEMDELDAMPPLEDVSPDTLGQVEGEPRGAQANRWLEVGIALLTVGLAFVVGIRYLTAKKKN